MVTVTTLGIAFCCRKKPLPQREISAEIVQPPTKTADQLRTASSSPLPQEEVSTEQTSDQTPDELRTASSLPLPQEETSTEVVQPQTKTPDQLRTTCSSLLERLNASNPYYSSAKQAESSWESELVELGELVEELIVLDPEEKLGLIAMQTLKLQAEGAYHQASELYRKDNFTGVDNKIKEVNDLVQRVLPDIEKLSGQDQAELRGFARI